MKNTVKNNKGNLLFKLAFSAFVVFCLISFISSQFTCANQQREINKLKNSIANQTAENAQLSILNDDDYEDEYIQSVARNSLGLVFPDDRVYRSVAGN